jgi:hypothetical protein
VRACNEVIAQELPGLSARQVQSGLKVLRDLGLVTTEQTCIRLVDEEVAAAQEAGGR